MENKDNVKFTHSCFIRKNTSDLRECLKQMGYNTVEHNNNVWLCCNPVSMENDKSYGRCISFSEDDIETGKSLGDYGLDCGDNETLFLAVAALRDDSDYAQWFTDNEDWHLCFSDDYMDYVGIEFYHKATVPEIIEYFSQVGDIADAHGRLDEEPFAKSMVECIQPCFIRKNTPELRKKLEALGYKDIQEHHISVIEKCSFLQIYSGYYMYEKIEKDIFPDSVDCGVNEEEFLRLASLKRDCK